MVTSILPERADELLRARRASDLAINQGERHVTSSTGYPPESASMTSAIERARNTWAQMERDLTLANTGLDLRRVAPAQGLSPPQSFAGIPVPPVPAPPQPMGSASIFQGISPHQPPPGEVPVKKARVKPPVQPGRPQPARQAPSPAARAKQVHRPPRVVAEFEISDDDDDDKSGENKDEDKGDGSKGEDNMGKDNKGEGNMNKDEDKGKDDAENQEAGNTASKGEEQQRKEGERAASSDATVCGDGSEVIILD
jgi:hypothetical protein